MAAFDFDLYTTFAIASTHVPFAIEFSGCELCMLIADRPEFNFVKHVSVFGGEYIGVDGAESFVAVESSIAVESFGVVVVPFGNIKIVVSLQ